MALVLIHLSENVIKNRNFDPESRTLRKRTKDTDVAMDDTVEKDIEGLAEKIIAQDEHRRAQELVGAACLLSIHPPTHDPRTFSTSLPNDQIGI